MGLEAGGRGDVEEEKKEEKEKTSHMCESIGHRPLRGRCPAPPSTSTTTYLSRARVPLTIERFCDFFLCLDAFKLIENHNVVRVTMKFL